MKDVTTESAGSAALQEVVNRRASSARLLKALKLISIAVIVWWLIAWVAARLLIVTVDVPRPDMLVVLGGSSTYVERTRLAATLWSSEPYSEIVLTNDGQKGGWSSAKQTNPFFIERAAEQLSAVGIPASRVTPLPQVVSSTYDEAVVVRQYAKTRNVHSILVVTSAYHSRRALWTMRKVFAGTDITVGIHPVPPGQQTPSSFVWWFYPGGWKAVAGEYVKLVYYLVHFR